jgi:hypothetical protein
MPLVADTMANAACFFEINLNGGIQISARGARKEAANIDPCSERRLALCC